MGRKKDKVERIIAVMHQTNLGRMVHDIVLQLSVSRSRRYRRRWGLSGTYQQIWYFRLPIFMLMTFTVNGPAFSQEFIKVIAPFYGVMQREIMLLPKTEQIRASFVQVIEFPSVKNNAECESALLAVKGQTPGANFLKEYCVQTLPEHFKHAINGISIPNAFSIRYISELAVQGEVQIVEIFFLSQPTQFKNSLCKGAVKGYAKQFRNVQCTGPRQL